MNHTYQLGIKLLATYFWDRKSLILVDFSIHNELGKKGNRGLRAKDLTAQFSKKRILNSFGPQREQELSICKIQMAIRMIKRAIKNGLIGVIDKTNGFLKFKSSSGQNEW